MVYVSLVQPALPSHLRQAYSKKIGSCSNWYNQDQTSSHLTHEAKYLQQRSYHATKNRRNVQKSMQKKCKKCVLSRSLMTSSSVNKQSWGSVFMDYVVSAQNTVISLRGTGPELTTSKKQIFGQGKRNAFDLYIPDNQNTDIRANSKQILHIRHGLNLKSKESNSSDSKGDLLPDIVQNTELQVNDDPLKSSLKTDRTVFTTIIKMVENPVYNIFNYLSQTNKSPVPNQSNELNEIVVKSTEVQSADDSKPEEPPPKSLLETLFLYIPYAFSSNSSKGISLKKDVKKIAKETSRIQAERDVLVQKVNINNRTRYLIQSIRDSNSFLTISQRVNELSDHLLRFPDTRITAVKENATQDIMHLYRTTYNHELIPKLRMTLAMLGAVDPPKQKGIRILTIDGGGCRGVVSVEILAKLVELCGQPINEMFDYVCGVSTGALLAFMTGLKKKPIEECGYIYRDIGSSVFNQSKLAGSTNLMMSHAYYDTELYQKLLKERFGSDLMIETAAYENVPKCSAVSCLVNRLVLKPFVWRNYSIVPGTRHTHWPGTCRAPMWEALRASSAAPGYFEEFKKGDNIHQDGGLLTNNPTGVALNECRLLWPNSPIQCVVSVGTGRHEPTVGPTSSEFLGLKDKLLKVVDSATSVTEVHTVMYDLLPQGTYFRFNPFIREPLLLDDFEEDKLDMLVKDGQDYIKLNDHKIRACANTLMGKNI